MVWSATPSATRKFHGGDDQAVYAYAREDLDEWETRLERPLANGMFGENLTTTGVEVTHALIGERWRSARAVSYSRCPRPVLPVELSLRSCT